MRFFNCLIVLVFCVTSNSHAQSLDNIIKSLSENVAQKCATKKKIHLAVGDLVNNAGKTDPFASYVAEQVETNLINSDASLEILDRKHLKQLLSDNHLQSEGVIDEKTAKSSVSFIKVDGWVLGEITSLGNKFKITIKVIDVETSMIFASAASDFISDEVMKQFQLSLDKQNGVLQECEKNNTGEFCFVNQSNFIMAISIFKVPNYGLKNFLENITIAPNESQCLYSYQAGAYAYSYRHPNDYNVEGQFKVEQCLSKKLVLK